MEATTKDIVAMIELNKKRAELEFRKSVLGHDTSEEMKRTSAEAKRPPAGSAA